MGLGPEVVSSESNCRFRDHKFDNFYAHSPPTADSRRCVSYKGKYVHKVLVNHLDKLAQLDELTISTWP